jgi:hypothetical protein
MKLSELFARDTKAVEDDTCPRCKASADRRVVVNMRGDVGCGQCGHIFPKEAE